MIFGFVVSVVWEMIEWVGCMFVIDEIFVIYEDIIGDMVFGGFGVFVVGVFVVFVWLE